jgi:hypothetical protein
VTESPYSDQFSGEPPLGEARGTLTGDSSLQKTAAPESPLLTRDEAAGYCRVGLRTFDRRVAPQVRGLCIGARRFFDRRDIDRWLETQKDGHFTGIRERRPSRSGSGLPGSVVIDPLAKQIARRLKKKLLESSER